MAIKKDSLLVSIIITSLSQIAITLLNILILKLLAHLIVAEGFGIYLTIRRFFGLMFSFLILNMNMSLTRFISFYNTRAEQFFFFAVIVMTLLTGGFFFLSVIFKATFAQWLFDNTQYQTLSPNIFIFLFANCFHVLAVGYFRGKQQFRVMNLMEVIFWSIGLAAVYVFVAFPGDFQHQIVVYLQLYALLTFLSDCFFLARYGNFNRQFPAWKQLLHWRGGEIPPEFIRYGFSRLPSGILIESLFFIPVVLSTHLFGLKFAAYLGIMVAFIRMIQLVAYPIGIIFLPKFSALQASGEKTTIRKHSQMVLEFVMSFPFLLGAISFLFAKELILIWFGDNYSPVIPYLQIVSPFIGMIVVYVILQSILDGSSDYPYVNITTGIAFLGMAVMAIVLYQFRADPVIIVYSFALGISLLGVFAIAFTVRLFHLRLFSRKTVLAILWYFFIFLACFYSAQRINFQSLWLQISLKTGVSLILFALSYGFYRINQFEWIDEFWQRIASFNR